MVVLVPKRVLLIDDTDESIRVNRPEKINISCRGTRQNWSHAHPLDLGNLNTISCEVVDSDEICNSLR